MKNVAPVLLFIFLCSCSASVPVKKAPEKAPVALEHEYKTAKASADAGDAKKAVPRLKKLIEQAPNSDLADDAHFSLGNLYYSKQQYGEALNHYNAIIHGDRSSTHEFEATVRATHSLLKLGRAPEAGRSLASVEERKDLSTDQKIETARLRYEIATTEKKPIDAIRALVVLGESHPNPTEREKFRALAQELMEAQSSDEQLREISENKTYGFLRPQATYRLALLAAEKRDYSKSRRLLNEVTDMASGTELAERATTLIRQIDARNRVDGKTIGVILPLSGKQASIGYRALKAVQLGLGVYGRIPSNFRLAVIDSEGNPDVARRAVERLVTEDNVIAIVGGLMSKTAMAEAAKAQEFGVPAIMLSAKSGITQVGESIFRNALTSEMQVEHLVDVAMNKLGMRSFAIMFPNDPYGVEFANLFWDEVSARGGAITAAQNYDPKETDFRGQAQRLGGIFYLEDRAEEYRARLRALNEKTPKRSGRKANPTVEEILPPYLDFDGIFIPDSGRAVGLIAPMLAFHNISKIRLLGTNIWNSQNLVTRGQKFVENAVFPDAVLTSESAFQNSGFVTEFKSLFGEEPGVVELQAYDSALILRQLIASGESTRVGLQAKLATLQNFAGALGPLYVNSQREIRRPLTTLTIKDGKIAALAAPSSPQ
jgi:ABC-type branched-subunit amino acid transport system substrate-binding protein